MGRTVRKDVQIKMMGEEYYSMSARAKMYCLKQMLLTEDTRYVDEKLMESGNTNYIFHIRMYCHGTVTGEYNHHTYKKGTTEIRAVHAQ
jgi:hypothetical protein